MILYVNGDSHSAGAEAVNSAAFASDDRRYAGLGRRPHPENLEVSYGNHLAKAIGATLVCSAESASSNSRIIRTTTYDLIKPESMIHESPALIVIGWATWEREEWWDDATNTFWQVNAGGIGHDWPESIKSRYKQWVIDQMEPEVINAKLISAHDEIFGFHRLLDRLKLPHIFFNTYLDFAHLDLLGVDRYDWGDSYIAPYDPKYTYYNWLKEKGFQTATKTSYHFKADAHKAWADFLYANYVQKLLTN